MYVLYLRDKNGKFVPINAIKGEDGKSAYQQAVEGGFLGTEEEFIAILNGILNVASPASLDINHFDDKSNPHKVTAEQTGALPITGGVMTGSVQWNEGKTGIVGQSDGNVVIRNYKLTESGNDDVLAFQNTETLQNMLRMYRNGVPYSVYGQHNKPKPTDIGAIPSTIEESDRVQRICTGNHNYIHNKFDADVPEMPVVSNFTHYVTLDANNKVYAVLSIPVDYTNKAFYYTAQDKQWHEISVGSGGRIASGTYVGTGTYGADNPTIIPLPFKPKVVVVSLTDTTKNRIDATIPMVYGSRFGMVSSLSSTNWTSECNLPINLVWYDNELMLSYTLSAPSGGDWYQLNISGATYTWVAIG